MKLPVAYKSVTLYDEVGYDCYPPLGFCPFAEPQLGNGDTFGLYWPIGREDSEPIVAETYHDEWSIEPHFSSLDHFLAASAKVDRDVDAGSLVETPTLEEDPRSPAASLYAAREHLRAQRVHAAIECLETAVSVLPEYSEAQALLSSQYRRVGRTDDAIKSAIQSMISPPCFGAPPQQVAHWLSRQSEAPPGIESDPIWVNRERLTLRFGGVKHNDQYSILRDAIDTYLATAANVSALTLMQSYAQLMHTETVSFQEGHSFVIQDFVSWQCEVAARQHGQPRTLQLPNERS